jgi:hypothetical protein
MLLAATDIGVDSVYLWGATSVIAGNSGLCREFGIPEGFKPVSAVALGYAKEANDSVKALEVNFATNYIK